MTLSWNEIKDRALKFSKEWEGEERERAEKDTFWNEFFHVFGKRRRSVAVYEMNVKKLNDQSGYIDLFWKGTLLVEHKSKGKSLDAAFEQASDYFHGLKEEEIPRYVLVSDFARFRLYDLETKAEHEFPIEDLLKNVKLFGFIAGYQERTYKEEDPVNRQAAERMANLHEQLEATGYSGHDLEVLLVRLLFCLFAEDTGIFEEKDQFAEFIETKTKEDGSDLGAQLQHLFQVLNTPASHRQSSLDEALDAFPYVNGKLFEENIRLASFNSTMRQTLLWAAGMDWGRISPAIFGSMFQGVMNPEERRNLGAHYTSEKNILKLIGPLFLDGLREEFEKLKRLKTGRKKRFQAFHDKLASLKFLDPACGCGNFLIITYRELRLLEIELLRELTPSRQTVMDISDLLKIDVDQFYGIEIDDWPARIAGLAMWLMDHQMNMAVSETFGFYYARLPLTRAAQIKIGNALRMDWKDVVPPSELSFILGNPPFRGHQWRSKDQMEDMDFVFGENSKTKRLDYVTAWFQKASDFARSANLDIAFVATNSICQGEQVPLLWKRLFHEGAWNIHFAHRTFEWQNQAKGKAGVHVVIVGLTRKSVSKARLFIYENVKADPSEVAVELINGFLAPGPRIFISSRNQPKQGFPAMFKGSQPTDGGHLILDESEKRALTTDCPAAAKWVRQYMGGAEFLRGKSRYCLWLKECPPSELAAMPAVLTRLELVRQSRKRSPTKSVQEFSAYPALFTQDRQPKTSYLCLPEVSSENREYLPIAYLSSDVVCSNKLQIIPEATLYLFGVLNSVMHNAWIRCVSGRLESRISYSPSVYNNFPFPENPTPKCISGVEKAASDVIKARQDANGTLEQLYNPLTMPVSLRKAHKKLDRAVDLCYGSHLFSSEEKRLEFLFNEFIRG